MSAEEKKTEVTIEEAKAKVEEVATQAKDLAMAAYQKALDEGFFSHVQQYLQDMLMPWKRIDGGIDPMALKDEVLLTLQLKSPDPSKGFILYNVLAFYLGVFESLVMVLFGHSALSFLWNGALGFCIAYTLYWTITCARQKNYMFFSLIFIALYVAFNAFMALNTLIYVVPACFYAAKGLVELLQLANGFVLYKEVAGANLML